MQGTKQLNREPMTITLIRQIPVASSRVSARRGHVVTIAAMDADLHMGTDDSAGGGGLADQPAIARDIRGRGRQAASQGRGAGGGQAVRGRARRRACPTLEARTTESRAGTPEMVQERVARITRRKVGRHRSAAITGWRLGMSTEGTGRGFMSSARTPQPRQELLASTRDCLVHWAVPSLGRLTLINPTGDNTITDSRTRAKMVTIASANLGCINTSCAIFPLLAGTNRARPRAFGRR